MMWARRTRILMIGGVLTLALLATVLLQSPVPTQTVDEFMESPERYVDEEVALRGEVQDGTIDNGTMTFILEGSSATIRVSFADASVSNGLDDNRTVYAEGVVRYDGETYMLEAQIIKTSCPSKYEESESTA